MDFGILQSCPIGEERDSLTGRCTAVSCLSRRACMNQPGTHCEPSTRFCIRAPCPQYECVPDPSPPRPNPPRPSPYPTPRPTPQYPSQIIIQQPAPLPQPRPQTPAVAYDPNILSYIILGIIALIFLAILFAIISSMMSAMSQPTYVVRRNSVETI